jgi:transcriptional regulator with XRE-family HTH domain
MEKTDNMGTIHLGRKIERVRHLRGMSQAELGNLLGITKQAVSKMEQTENFDDGRLEEIASALGVTVEGLKKYNEEAVLYNMHNTYENCHATTSANTIHTVNNFPVDKIIELFENLLEKEREKFETLKNRKSRSP